jgi:hypothetical protein
MGGLMDARALGEAINRLVDEYRDRCLWFLRDDFYPASVDEQRRVLHAIARHGDVAAYRRARELETWLLRHFSETSAGS